MPGGETAFAPIGFLDFCARQPEECAPGETGAPAAAQAARPAAAETALDRPDLATSATGRGYWRPAAWPTAAKPDESAPADSPAGPSPQWRLALAFAARADAGRSTPWSWGPLRSLRTPPLIVAGEVVWGLGLEGPEAPSLAAAHIDWGALSPVAPRPEPPAASRPTFSEATSITLTRESAGLLERINRRVNGAITAQPDEITNGVSDHWDLPLEARGKAYGDCEDYVLEKRRALIREGVPPRALTIAIARTRWGELHAVLVVDTDKGDLVLDSLTPWVTPWNALNYAWVERQSQQDPMRWTAVAAG